MRAAAVGVVLALCAGCAPPPAAPAVPATLPASVVPAPAPAPPASPPAAPAPAATPPAPADAPLDPSPFVRLPAAEPGSWRARFPDDAAESFEEYVDGDPVRADDARRVIAFQPVGPFEPAHRAALDAAVEFTGLWFDLPTRVLPDVPLPDEPEQFRGRATPTGERHRQYRTGWFLHTLLPDRVPEDAVVLLGVTMADLYPGRDWNYVFGEAYLRRRVGVWSLVRYFPEFWGEPDDAAARRLALLRTLKVVVHETGHTFGLEHCAVWACAMNGSNSLPETDAQPLHLCPDCLRKLRWNRGLDLRSRYAKLAEFLGRHGLAAEAAWNRERAAGR